MQYRDLQALKRKYVSIKVNLRKEFAAKGRRPNAIGSDDRVDNSWRPKTKALCELAGLICPTASASNSICDDESSQEWLQTTTSTQINASTPKEAATPADTTLGQAVLMRSDKLDDDGEAMKQQRLEHAFLVDTDETDIEEAVDQQKRLNENLQAITEKRLKDDLPLNPDAEEVNESYEAKKSDTNLSNHNSKSKSSRSISKKRKKNGNNLKKLKKQILLREMAMKEMEFQRTKEIQLREHALKVRLLKAQIQKANERNSKF